MLVDIENKAGAVKNNKKRTNVIIPTRHCMVVHARYPMGETRVEREARALLKHGCEVDVICLLGRDDSVSEKIDGVNVYRMPVSRHKGNGLISQLFEYMTFFILAGLKLVALHRHRHYHAVQTHNLPDWLVFVGLIPKLTGARIILDLHDLMPEFFAARYNRSFSSWPVRLLIWQEKLSCWFADHVITVTEAWRNTLIQRGVAPDKVTVVMNVADDHIFIQSKIIEPGNIDNHHLRLLYHGNLTHHSGVDLAIRAVDLLKHQIPTIHLHIHGWGDSRKALQELVDESGLKDKVSFSTQELQTSELPALISQADICLVPYRRDVFSDGILPTKLMEYASVGKPVIAAHTPTIAQYFDESMVQFFTPGDEQDLARCLRTLYEQPERRQCLAEGILKFNQRYSWSDQSAQYVHLIERLVQAQTGQKVEAFPGRP